MSLEYKVRTGEGSLLKRFLDGAKSKISTGVLGLALAATAISGCDDKRRRVTPPPANNAPVITTTAPTSSLEGSLYNYDVDASDAEGDAISYSLDSAPLWASINATTGLISGTPSDSGANRIDNFSVRATDAKGAYSVQNFGLNVTNLGTVSGTIVDIDGNGLVSKTVGLYNSTYPKTGSPIPQARFRGLTDGSGNFTLVDTVTSSSGIPNRSDWNFEVTDTFTGIFPFVRPNFTTSGDSFSYNPPQMILMHTIASTNTAYQDSLGNASFLQLFKYDTALKPSDPPGTSGPHPTTNWPSLPQNINLSIATAPSTDNDSNGVPDVVDNLRTAMSEWNSRTSLTLFNEVTTPISQGIRIIWNTTNSFTNVDSTNGDGTYQRITVNINTSQPMSSVLKDEKHEIGHALYNIRHSADSTNYILATPTSATSVHIDEGRVAKYNLKLPHRTNMDGYVDR